MSQHVIDRFFANDQQANLYQRESARKERRNNFFRKGKNNPDNRRRYRDYLDDADLAIAHADALEIRDRFENGQCICIVLWRDRNVLEVRVINKMNHGESMIRLRKYPNGWREDYNSWNLRRPSWRPLHYKRHGKNVRGMKQMANKHIRHKARLFVRDCDEYETWKEEIAPSSPSWYKRAFCSYDICDY